MDFYLTNIRTGDRLRFPIRPNRIAVKTGSTSVSMNLIQSGEAKFPRGTTVSAYSWSGIFPGAMAQFQSFVFDWQEPPRIVAILKTWLENNDILRLMVTELGINADVYIDRFDYEYYGFDDCSYTINLMVKRELYVTSTEATVIPQDDMNLYGTVSIYNAYGYIDVYSEPTTNSTVLGHITNRTRILLIGRKGNWYLTPYSSGKDGIGYVYASHVVMGAEQDFTTSSSTSAVTTATGSVYSGGESSGGSSGSRSSGTNKAATAKSTGRTYTVTAADVSLLSVSNKTLGNMLQWNQIYELNKDLFDSLNKNGTSKYTLHEGMVLQLPEVNTAAVGVSKAVSTATSTVGRVVSSAVSALTNAAKTTTTTKPSTTKVTVSSLASKVVNAASSVVKTGINALANFVKNAKK